MKKFFILGSFILLFVANIFAAPDNLIWKKDYLGAINTLKVTDLFNNGKNYTVLGCERGVAVLDENGKILWINSTLKNVYKIKIADLDNDGTKEIIGSTYLDFFVVEADGSNFIYNTVSSFGTSAVPFVVDDFNNDGKKEISVKYNSSNSEGYFTVYFYGYDKNNNYLDIEWYKFVENVDIFNNLITSADIYGNNKKSVVLVSKYKGADNETLIILNLDTKTIDNITVPVTIENYYSDYINAIDSNNDGKDEIVLGYYYDGKAVDLDPVNKNILWSLDTTYYVKKVFMNNVDNDNKKEIVILTNDKPYLDEATHNRIYAYNFDNNSLNLKWQANFDNSTKATMNNVIPYNTNKLLADLGHKLLCINGSNGNLIWEKTVSENLADYYYKVKFDYSEADNIIAGGINLYKFNSTGDKSLFFENGLIVKKVLSGDIDGDGVDEVATLDERAIHLYDSTGKLLWWKAVFPDNGKIVDIDNDGKAEIILFSENGKYLKVLKGDGSVLWDNNSINFPNIVKVTDIDNNGTPDIIIANWGAITAFENNGNILFNKTLSNYGGQIQSMNIADINNDGNKEIIYTLNYMEILDNEGNGTNNLTGTYEYKNIQVINNKIVCSDKTKVLLFDNNLNKLWEYDFGEYANLVKNIKIHNGYIYVTNGDKLIKLDVNKNLLWTFNASNPTQGNTTALKSMDFIDSNIGVGGYKFYIIDDTTGTKKYIMDPGENGQFLYQGYSSPVTAAKLFVDKNNFVFGQMGVYAYGDNGTLPTKPECSSNNLTACTTATNCVNNGGYWWDNQCNAGKNTNLVVQQGWNLDALPVKIENGIIPSDSFNNDNISTIWKWTGNSWQIWSPNANITSLIGNYGISKVATIFSGEGFWINAKATATVAITGGEGEYGIEELSINNGWNLLGLGKTILLSEFNKFGTVSTIWKWTGNSWQIWSPDANITSLIGGYGISTIQSIEKGEGFWVKQ